jgi:extracellular matrix regulatory protein A
MEHRLINVGFGNAVLASRVLAVVNPKSSPMKKLREEAKEQKRLIDVTEGRRTRSIIILDSNHVILSSVQPETITLRFSAPPGKERFEDEPMPFPQKKAGK